MTFRREHGQDVSLALSHSAHADGVGWGTSKATDHAAGRLQAEEALRRSEADFRELAGAIPQMVWVAAADGSPLFTNERWAEYTGLPFDEGRALGWHQSFDPEDLLRTQQVWQEAVAKASEYSVECRLRRRDGVYRWWLLRGAPVVGPDGAIAKWFGTFTDIDDLKLAERRIAESEERFSKIFHSGLMALSIAGQNSGRFFDVNGRWCELFGYTRIEVVGRTVFELGLWASPDDCAAFISQVFAPGVHLLRDASFRHKSGDLFHTLVAVEPVTLTGIEEPLVITALVDVTQRKVLESQLIQAQKMEGIGLLAGGVAHDFNNVLAVILGNAELLAGEVAAPQREGVGEILRAANHAAALTRQLLAFSRKQAVDPRPLDINELLSNLERMLVRLIGEDIDLAILPGSQIGLVKADAGQLEQVVVNLCVNARHAMPDGGLLRIDSANVRVAAGEAPIIGAGDHGPIAPGDWVRLMVTDSGCGISEDVLPRVFEPFFTTKKIGEGTGLGLSMVFATVRQAGGHIRVESKLGRGTSVAMYFPRTEELPAPLVGPVTATVGGTETVLVVEDEAPVRALLRTILVRAGYRVLEAASGTEAIDLAQRDAETIHVVLTDVVMPGLNGRAMSEALMAARPNLKVIFMSGYTFDIVARNGVVDDGAYFLQKPFTGSQLLSCVREALLARDEAGLL